MHYTQNQLLRFVVADLCTDVRCAVRDNQPEYAQDCRNKIARIFANRRRIKFDAYGYPVWS